MYATIFFLMLEFGLGHPQFKVREQTTRLLQRTDALHPLLLTLRKSPNPEVAARARHVKTPFPVRILFVQTGPNCQPWDRANWSMDNLCGEFHGYKLQIVEVFPGKTEDQDRYACKVLLYIRGRLIRVFDCDWTSRHGSDGVEATIRRNIPEWANR